MNSRLKASRRALPPLYLRVLFYVRAQARKYEFCFCSASCLCIVQIIPLKVDIDTPVRLRKAKTTPMCPSAPLVHLGVFLYTHLSA